ncbi:MAG: FeoA family protein [Candidatus Micrarchaeota archaeon]
MISLLQAEKNQEFKVERIEGGRNMRQRLCDLGVYEGARIRVLRADYGPVIIKVLDSKIAIGRGQAQRIIVSKVGDG